ncbi:MAG: hypothetical protein F7B17_05710 [Desulfurococcales archaeon]|nr:hypothetical protein [Desulfurococcales archaeon]
MPSKVLSALGLLFLTLAGAGLLYVNLESGVEALRPEPEPVLVYVTAYDPQAGTAIFYVAEGCVESPNLLVYDEASNTFIQASRACAGSLVVLPEAEALPYLR